jgi:hypothetical protein
MSYLLEQPLAVVIVGVIAALGAGIAWTSTGRKEWLVGLGAVVVLTIGGLILEQVVVTDREAIESTLTEIARDVESNNIRALVRHIATGATVIQQAAEAEMPKYRFEECRVTKVHNIDIDATQEPRSALVEFNVIATGSFSDGGFELTGQQVYRWVQLHMVREKDGRWRVQSYKHDDPQHFMYNRDSDDDNNR